MNQCSDMSLIMTRNCVCCCHYSAAASNIKDHIVVDVRTSTKDHTGRGWKRRRSGTEELPAVAQDKSLAGDGMKSLLRSADWRVMWRYLEKAQQQRQQQ